MPSAAKRENIETTFCSLQECTHARVWSPDTLEAHGLGRGPQRVVLNTSSSHDVEVKGDANPPFIWPAPETESDASLEEALSGWWLLTGGKHFSPGKRSRE